MHVVIRLGAAVIFAAVLMLGAALVAVVEIPATADRPIERVVGE